MDKVIGFFRWSVLPRARYGPFSSDHDVPGLSTAVRERRRQITVEWMSASDPGSGAGGRFLDALPTDKRVVVTNVMSPVLQEMLVRRWFSPKGWDEDRPKDWVRPAAGHRQLLDHRQARFANEVLHDAVRADDARTQELVMALRADRIDCHGASELYGRLGGDETTWAPDDAGAAALEELVDEHERQSGRLPVARNGRTQELARAYRDGTISLMDTGHHSPADELFRRLGGRYAEVDDEGYSIMSPDGFLGRADSLERLVDEYELHQPGRLASMSEKVLSEIGEDVSLGASRAVWRLENDVADEAYLLGRRAVVSDIQASMSVGEAFEILNRDVHVGCHLNVEQCAQCSSAERMSWEEVEARSDRRTAAQGVWDAASFAERLAVVAKAEEERVHREAVEWLVEELGIQLHDPLHQEVTQSEKRGFGLI